MSFTIMAGRFLSFLQIYPAIARGAREKREREKLASCLGWDGNYQGFGNGSTAADIEELVSQSTQASTVRKTKLFIQMEY